MAERARRRAAALGKPDGVAIGLGATASLASDRPKRGDHRCHIAVATAAATDLTSIVLEKGLRDRAGEEGLVARAITLCLARGCEIPAPSPSSLLAPGEGCTHTSLPSTLSARRAFCWGRSTASPRAGWPARVVCTPHSAAVLPAPSTRGTTDTRAWRRRRRRSSGRPFTSSCPCSTWTSRHSPPPRSGGASISSPGGPRWSWDTGPHLPREVPHLSERHVRDRGRHGGASRGRPILRSQ